MTASYADIIFFAAVAIYLGLKLFSILGKKNERDINIETRRPATVPDLSFDKDAVQQQKVIVPVEKNRLENFIFLSEDAKTGVKEIIEKDPSFELESFIDGAKIALEMLLKAYSTGDKKDLKLLLADDIYVSMEKELDEAAKQNHINTKSLVAIEKVEIVSASVSGSRSRIALLFLTEQINVTKDTNGNVIAGNPKMIENVEDHVEFERNIRSSNPNWSIISI